MRSHWYPMLSMDRVGGRHGKQVRAVLAVARDGLYGRLDVAGDLPAGVTPRLGDGHGVGIADGGVAPAPAHHAGEEVGPHYYLGQGPRSRR